MADSFGYTTYSLDGVDRDSPPEENDGGYNDNSAASDEATTNATGENSTVNGNSRPASNDDENKILSSTALIGVLLATLLGGLAIVVRALRNVNLHLVLDLKKDDKAEKKY